MKILICITVFVFFIDANGSTLKVLHPKNVNPKWNKEVFDAKQLLKFNKHILGLHTIQNLTDSKLFNRPRALVIFVVSGMEDSEFPAQSFKFKNNFHDSNIKDHLENVFGSEMEHSVVDSDGIRGSNISKHAENIELNHEISPKTKDLVARNELINLYKLREAIRHKVVKRNAVDYYKIHLNAASSKFLNEQEKFEAIEDVRKGIVDFDDIVRKSYDDMALTEVYSQSDLDLVHLELNKTRTIYAVTRANNQDTPAMFAIFLTVIGSFLFALISAITFLFDEGDMGINSIVYRLSNAKSKKEK